MDLESLQSKLSGKDCTFIKDTRIIKVSRSCLNRFFSSFVIAFPLSLLLIFAPLSDKVAIVIISIFGAVLIWNLGVSETYEIDRDEKTITRKLSWLNFSFSKQSYEAKDINLKLVHDNMAQTKNIFHLYLDCANLRHEISLVYGEDNGKSALNTLNGALGIDPSHNKSSKRDAEPPPLEGQNEYERI